MVNNNLVLVAALALVAACEPQPEVGPRMRTSPELKSFDSCDALYATYQKRLTRDANDRVLANAYASMSGGMFGGSPPPVYADAEYEAYYFDVIQTVQGTEPMLVHGGNVYLTTAGGLQSGFTVVPLDGASFGASTVVPLGSSDERWANPVGFAARPDGRVSVVWTTELEIGERPEINPDEDRDIPKGFAISLVTVIDVYDPGVGLLDEQRTILSGRPTAVFVGDDATVVLTSHQPPLPFLEYYPRADNVLLPFGGLAQAVAETQARNQIAILAMTRDMVLPRRGATFEGSEPSIGEDCNNIVSADDSTGTTFLTVAHLPHDMGDVAQAKHVMGETGRVHRLGGDIVVAEKAQGTSWHLGTELPPMSNIHRLSLDDDATPTSRRIEGWLTGGGLYDIAGGAAMLISDGVRSPYSFLYSDPRVLWLPPSPDDQPVTLDLAHPTHAPVVVEPAGSELLVGLDDEASVRVEVRDGQIIPLPMPDGEVRFAHQIVEGRTLAVLWSYLSGLQVTVLNRAGRVTTAYAITEARDPSPDPGDPLAEPVGVYDAYVEPGASRPLYVDDRDVLLFPRHAFYWEESTGQERQIAELHVIGYDDGELQSLATIEHRGQVNRALPIRNMHVTDDGLLVLSSDQRLTLHRMDDFSLLSEVVFEVGGQPDPVPGDL